MSTWADGVKKHFFPWFFKCFCVPRPHWHKLASVSVLKASWERLGSILGASWGHLGPSWSRLGVSCGCLGAFCGRRGAVSKASWRGLEPSLGRLGAILASIISDVENNGKRRTRSTSEAPNASHRHFEKIRTSVAAVWRVRGAPGSTFSIILIIFDIIWDAILKPL